MTNNHNENGGVIECSNCSVPLVEVWITEENSSQETKIVAVCDHCDDQSFEKKIIGKFYLGGTDYSSIDSIDTDNVKEEESVITYQEITVKTRKTEEYG